MAEPATVTRCDGVVNYLRTLKPEDNGTGVIEETDFDRWLEKIFVSIEVVASDDSPMTVKRETKD